MLSDCEVIQEDEIECKKTAADIAKAFDKLPQYKDIMSSLLSLKYVAYINRRFILGQDNELFIEKANPFKQELQLLEEQLNHSFTSRNYLHIHEVYTALVTQYLHKVNNIKDGRALATMFKAVYHIVYGEEFPRATFTGKEIGQFNFLAKNYSNIVATKMLIHYVMNATNPSIGFLVTAKDTWYAKACGVTKTTQSAYAAKPQRGNKYATESNFKQ
jgi:hypothetical protein